MNLQTDPTLLQPLTHQKSSYRAKNLIQRQEFHEYEIEKEGCESPAACDILMFDSAAEGGG